MCDYHLNNDMFLKLSRCENSNVNGKNILVSVRTSAHYFALCKGGVFIPGGGSAISSARQGKPDSIYNLVKNS